MLALTARFSGRKPAWCLVQCLALRVISQSGCVAKSATSPVCLMPVRAKQALLLFETVRLKTCRFAIPSKTICSCSTTCFVAKLWPNFLWPQLACRKGTAVSAFLGVQLRRLAPRGLKSSRLCGKERRFGNSP
jgi:hypothetical protein